MIRKIILGFVLVLGLSVQSQTKKPQPSYETKVKNYVEWFESLPDHKKREESNILVMKLNMMSAYDRSMWLATSAKYSKTPEVKKNIIDSLSNEGVKKKLFALLTNNVSYVNKEGGEKLDTIVIISSSTARYRTDSINAGIRKKIADWKVVITEADRKMDSIGGSADYHYRNGDKVYMDAYHDKENGNDKLPRLRSNIIIYDGTSDNRWNSYLIDIYEVEMQLSVPHKLTNEELDSGISSSIKFDKVKRRYSAEFIRGINYYKDGIRDDKRSTFSIRQLNLD
jgi:hypothetical protein